MTNLGEGKKQKRQKAYGFGKVAEQYASQFLKLKGYQELEVRYKTPSGEVDLVMKKGDCLVFVEVKARKNLDELDLISPRQQQRIEKAAMLFIANHPEFANFHMRFDVITVNAFWMIKHVENAWLSTD